MTTALQNRIESVFRNAEQPVILGPTASGKTEISLFAAERFGGEIISADAMQFYRGMDIGTAKATPEERARVPHHLIDTMDISEKSDIFRFKAEAEAAASGILARGKRPIVTGGSGLYLYAYVYGLDDLPAKQELRDELDSKYDNDAGFPELLDYMKQHCPADYERFHEHRRKLIRACEVFLLCGKQMTELQQVRKAPVPKPGITQIFPVWNREVLKERILRRTAVMLKSGWIEEGERLLKAGLKDTPTAWQALGYSQIAEYLSGQYGYEELEERIAIATWQYARRQLTWFNHKHPEAIRLIMEE